MNSVRFIIFSSLVLLINTVAVSAARMGRRWKSWDDDWSGSSKSSKTAQPTFYPTLSPTSGKSSKSSWGGWRGGGGGRKKTVVKKKHNTKHKGHHWGGRDLAVGMGAKADEVEMDEKGHADEFFGN